MNAVTRISEKGQVVVPKAARDRLGWTPGTALEIVETSDSVTLRPLVPGGRLTMDQAMARLREIVRYEGDRVPVEQLSWSPELDDDALDQRT